ncbi:hypothetical protein LOK49_LG04G00523 [Camellia lanceoleosa]|uniref:Uncharacterized protein n=1 Tax=Camellia lanceoleosa TaxID=1840588 RepID=A0ACC0HXN7_9ERIC|nr:hypothetical protein LOK49_LG04G00523 [Camellia lanceoleosa]
MENRMSFRKRLKLITDSTSSETSPASEKLITDSASSETSLASSEVIASNVDLLSEILLRLPPKSLLRFMDLGGRRKRISERRSTLLAMTSAEARTEVSDEAEVVIAFLLFLLQDILFAISASAQRCE